MSNTQRHNPSRNDAAEALIRKLRSQKWTSDYKEGAEILTGLCESWTKHGKQRAFDTPHEFKEGQAVHHRKEYVVKVRGKPTVKKTTCDTVKFLTAYREWALVEIWKFSILPSSTQAATPYCVPLREIFSIPKTSPHCPECEHMKVVGTFKPWPNDSNTQPYRLEYTLENGSVVVGCYFDTEEEARAVGCGTGYEIKERERPQS